MNYNQGVQTSTATVLINTDADISSKMPIQTKHNAEC